MFVRNGSVHTCVNIAMNIVLFNVQIISYLKKEKGNKLAELTKHLNRIVCHSTEINVTARAHKPAIINMECTNMRESEALKWEINKKINTMNINSS